jgi:hypothetical protein
MYYSYLPATAATLKEEKATKSEQTRLLRRRRPRITAGWSACACHGESAGQGAGDRRMPFFPVAPISRVLLVDLIFAVTWLLFGNERACGGCSCRMCVLITINRSVHAFPAPYLVSCSEFCWCSALIPFLHSASTAEAERAAERPPPPAVDLVNYPPPPSSSTYFTFKGLFWE